MRETTKDNPITVRLPFDHKAVVVRAAALERVCVSDFVRDLIVPAAKDRVVAHALQTPMGDVA